MINCIGCILNRFLVYDYIKMTSELNVYQNHCYSYSTQL